MSTLHETTRRHVIQGTVATSILNSDTGYQTGWHSHDDFMMLLPRSGGLIMRTETDRSPYRVNASCLALVAPGLHHATASTRPEQKHLAIYVDAAYVAGCLAQLGQRDSGASLTIGVWRLTPALVTMLRVRDELAEATGNLKLMQLQAVDRLLAAECLTAAASTPNVLSSVRLRDALLIHEIHAYIEAHLAERISLDDIAAQFLLSRRHLTRLFRERSGSSVVDFVNTKRVEHARRLLTDPTTSVLEAALAVGIDSPSYFAKLYKREFGHSPNVERRR